MDRNKIQVGFIGVGGIAEKHLSGLATMEDVHLAGFCDVSAPRVEKMAQQYGARAFTSPAQMFDALKLDAVYICLPPFAHGEAELTTIERGVPFLVEKPLGLDLALAKQIATAVEAKGLLTATGYMNRYRQSINTVRDLLQDDPPILVDGGWIGKSRTGTATEGIGTWWTVRSKSGGQFVEQTTHTVDIVRYLCGDAASVFAYAASGFHPPIPNYDIDDASIVTIKLKRGGIATLLSSCSIDVDNGVFLNVRARKLSARFTGWGHDLTLKRADADTVTIPAEQDIFAIEDRAFIDAVKTQDQSKVRSNYSDGVKTLAITLAANESMRTGQPVMLD